MINKRFECSECESIDIMSYCINCEVFNCFNCDQKVHNIGKRFQHQRKYIFSINSKIFKFYDYLKKNEICNNFYYNKEFKMVVNYYFSFDNNKFLSILTLIGLMYWFKKAKKGCLMIKYDNFINFVIKFLLKEKFIISKVKLKNFFSKKNSSFFNITTRIFGDIFKEIFISLKLKYISLECILWVLKSTENDLIQPNDRWVLSRIKEYFALKIDIKIWVIFMKFLKKNINIVKNKPIVYNLRLKKEIYKDNTAINNKYDYIFNIKNKKYNYEDLEKVEKNDPNWHDFINFIQTFFEEKVDYNYNLEKWFTSIENNENKNKTSYKNLLNILKEKNIYKVIPGGKYGCALFIKCCGTKTLKSLSLGKILSYIQLALDFKILIYFKTLLIKNNFTLYDENKNNKNNEQINKIKNSIINLLSKNIEINLSDLPKILSKNYEIIWKIQDLGFSKLTNLIETFEEISIIRKDGNNVSVRLKELSNLSNSKNSEKNIKRFYTIKNKKLTEDHNLEIKKLRANSNINDYLEKIKINIIKLVKLHKEGIEINQLQKLLSKELKSDFNPHIFKYETFEQFIWSVLGDSIKIYFTMKKSKIYNKENFIKNVIFQDNSNNFGDIFKNKNILNQININNKEFFFQKSEIDSSSSKKYSNFKTNYNFNNEPFNLNNIFFNNSLKCVNKNNNNFITQENTISDDNYKNINSKNSEKFSLGFIDNLLNE